MAQINYYKEETKCENCGRHIKNVIEIDNVKYGVVCAEQFMPKSEFLLAKRDFNQAIINQQNSDKKALYNALIEYGTSILDCGAFSPMLNRTTEFYEEWLSTRAHHKLALGVTAILQARYLYK